MEAASVFTKRNWHNNEDINADDRTSVHENVYLRFILWRETVTRQNWTNREGECTEWVRSVIRLRTHDFVPT